MRRPISKAVFPVAGLGTRFLPATKVIPKEMLPVVDKPLIQYAVEECLAAGITEFIFVTATEKSVITDHFLNVQDLEIKLKRRNNLKGLKAVKDISLKPDSIRMAVQSEPLGLGHAVWCARELIGDEHFAVVLPDDLVLSRKPCLQQLLEVYEKVGGHVVAVEDVPRERTNQYGILDVQEESNGIVRAEGLVEKPDPSMAPSTLAIVGRYLLAPSVFVELDKSIEGAGGEIQLTDALARTAHATTLHGYRFNGRRFDCGSKEGFLEANIAFAINHPDFAIDARDRILAVLAES